MTHEKLVAGTESPTRYTKIIRNPGAGTKYNRTYQETGYVSRYTKTVAGGKDYAPSSPPFTVADGQGANWVGDNVYEVGQTIEGKTAAFTGGLEPVTYRYRFQFKATGSDTWVNGNWTTTTNSKNSVTYELTETGQVKLQSQARDSQDPSAQSNSVTGIKTVTAEIGEVTVNPDTTAVAVMGNATFTAVVTGGDATDLTYKWTVRSGNAQLDTPDNEATVTYTFIRDGQAQIQCSVSSASSSNSPQTNLAFVIVSN